MPFELKEILDAVGVFQHGFVETSAIGFSGEVRKMCEVNTCRKYAATWACPPAIGTVEECRDRCLSFRKMLVFSGKYELEDSYDYEGMMAGRATFKAVARDLEKALKPHLDRHIMLANEGCGLCAECTYPGAPCRFPDQVHGAIEGYGIFVNILAQQAGMNYINGTNTVTYFGGLLHDEFIV